MTKKFAISLLFTVVFAGLVLFASSAAWAPPPTDTLRVFHCENGELAQFTFDGDALINGEWCDTNDITGPGQCSNWQQMEFRATSYVCNGTKSICRLLAGAEFFVSCSPQLGGAGGSIWCRLFGCGG